MVNAMGLAEATGGTFIFHWSPMPERLRGGHAILDAQDTFSDAFLQRHFVQKSFVRKARVIGLSEYDSLLSRDALDASRFDAVLVNQSVLKRQAPFLFDSLAQGIDFGQVFGRIEFSAAAEVARNAAGNVQLDGNPVAIHLRAGDIIFGKYRMTDRYNGKVVSVPVAEELIRSTIGAGSSVIVFGQDEKVIGYLQRRYGVLSAPAIRRACGFTELQDAVFDICLMSRCTEIFAGSSGFAGIASWVGGRNVTVPRRAMDPAAAVVAISEFLADRRAARSLDPLHFAFACRTGCLLANATVPTSEPFLSFMEAASRYDPDNDFYVVVRACSHYELGNSAEAERILAEVLGREGLKQRPIAFTLTGRPPVPGELFVGELRATIDKHARCGHPMAALCAAICSHALGEFAMAESFVKAAEKSLPSDRRGVFDNVCSAFGLSTRST